MATSKRELDKENMFNKIMPTNLMKNTSENNSRQGIDTEAIPQNKIKNTQPLATDRKINFINRKNTVMVNIMEKMVSDKLDSAFNKFNCCKCDRCRQDVAAMALNKLKPKYIIADENQIDDIIAKQDDSAVTAAIIQAILVVRTHPRH